MSLWTHLLCPGIILSAFSFCLFLFWALGFLNLVFFFNNTSEIGSTESISRQIWVFISIINSCDNLLMNCTFFFWAQIMLWISSKSCYKLQWLHFAAAGKFVHFLYFLFEGDKYLHIYMYCTSLVMIYGEMKILGKFYGGLLY